MNRQYVVRRDTSAWVAQVWASFVIAVVLCAYGVLNMPSNSIDRAFLALGFVFVLSSVFVLSKTLRDNQAEQVDSPFWRVQTWVAFSASVSLTAWGLLYMAVEQHWHKLYLIAASLFLMSTAFTLAKTLRDRHEADVIEAPRLAPA